MCCKLNLFLNLPCCSLHFIAGKTYLERVSSWQLQRTIGNFCFWYNKIFTFFGVLGNDLSIAVLMSQLKFYSMPGRESHSRRLFCDVKMGHLLVILGEKNQCSVLNLLILRFLLDFCERISCRCLWYLPFKKECCSGNIFWPCQAA